MDNMQPITSEKIGNIRLIPCRFTPILVGLIVGLFTAAVFFDKVFPSWVPIIFSKYPVLFFGLFMIICGFLGYLWALAEDHTPQDTPDPRTKAQVLNSVFTGMVCGLFGATVLYDKTQPDWVPKFLVSHPVVFFGLFIIVCGSLGYIWTLPDEEPSSQKNLKTG